MWKESCSEFDDTCTSESDSLSFSTCSSSGDDLEDSDLEDNFRK